MVIRRVKLRNIWGFLYCFQIYSLQNHSFWAAVDLSIIILMLKESAYFLIWFGEILNFLVGISHDWRGTTEIGLLLRNFLLNSGKDMSFSHYVWSACNNNSVLQNSQRCVDHISESDGSGWVLYRLKTPTKALPFIGVQSPAGTPWSGTVECNNRNALIPECSSRGTYDVGKRADVRRNMSCWYFACEGVKSR